MMDADECKIQEGVMNSNLLRVHLAQALRSIQWSYAIFWSISANKPGVLEWVDGYYNGDIKTRKTVQAEEVNAEQMGLQRSEQLRELYESLLVGETNPLAKRPSASLSPEDLTEAEWYYLVCMSFTFNIEQGLPGRTLSKNQTIWLCNAHQVESKVFSRSLLAKSACIKTVVCFPCLGGAIELGATELVPEDLNIVERVKASLLEIPYPAVGIVSTYNFDNVKNDEDINSGNSDHHMPETDRKPLVEGEGLLVHSPIISSNGFGTNHRVEDTYIVEGVNNEASQVGSWYLMDDETSNQVQNPVNSTESISKSHASPRIISHLSNEEKLQNGIQECNPRGEDIHYQSVLSTLLKGSDQLILGPYLKNGRRDSSFISWKNEAFVNFQMPQNVSRQRLLKKVLFEVAKMHTGSSAEPGKDNGKSESFWQVEVNEIDKKHAFAESRRRGKLNDKFEILGSLVPTNGKVDKLSILDDTIDYVKELERRVQELESCKELAPKTRMLHDDVERTSDNYGTTKRATNKKRRLNKRKDCDIEHVNLMKDNSNDDVTVSVIDKDISIEMRFPWREGVLIEIMETMSNLHLDSNSIQSTNSEGILFIAIKSKMKESEVSSAGVIRQALQRVITKS